MSLTTFLKRGYNMKETDELFKLATITLTGAVLLGKSVVCDGYSEGRTTAVFTHIHKDHSEAVPTCLGRCDNVYSSKPTLDMLKSLYGEHVGRRFNFEAIDYNSSRMPESEKITLLESRHMLGAAQVLVETSNQIKLVYSSDFTSKDSIPHKCNVLVIDSTHGDPMFDTNVDAESIERRFLEFVDATIQTGSPLCTHAHMGRLQYVMHLISERINPEVKFVASNEDIQLAKVYRKYGMKIRDIEGDPYYAKKIFNGTYPYAEFKHHLTLSDREEAGMIRFFLMGSHGGSTIAEHDDNSYHLEFDEHAKFSDIINYVVKCDPEIVITDNYRTPHGGTLAEIITKELNKPAKAMPIKK